MSEPSCPLPAQAYDLAILHEQGCHGPERHGWCFGLPPGISREQWPLDPKTGYPLVHSFTLRLPPDYRCHGPDIAGLSLFACCWEHSDGGTTADEAIQSAMTGISAPADQRYLSFWTAEQTRHPRLSRMSDDLDDNFAVILLTESELNGPPCRPPDVAAARALSVHRPPRWLDAGSGRAFFDFGTLPKELHEMLGDIPPAQLDWSRALRWSPRVNDPNAGKAPADFFSTNNPSGYQQPYYYEGGVIGAGNFREHSWTAGHAPNHIGGTMRPVQGVPKFSAFYIEFEEYFGGYNFGGGNGQLDFLNMRLDWACG